MHVPHSLTLPFTPGVTLITRYPYLLTLTLNPYFTLILTLETYSLHYHLPLP